MTQQVWLVTGCSSGFGEAFVHEILSRGDKVIATGRNAAKKLAHLKDTGAVILDLDVTAPQSEINARIEEAIGIYGHIDVLINNAGYVQMGFVEETSNEIYANQLNTNFFGAIATTTALLPHFRARRSGKIAFINSIFSWTSSIAVAPYAVSKHALAAYAQSLEQEVSQFGIQVVSFDVGHFRTPVLSPEQSKAKVAEIEDYKPMVKVWRERGKGMSGNQPGDPKLGIKRMVEILTGSGMAVGKTIPSRITIGGDAVDIIRKKCEDTLRSIAEWEEVSRSTDFDEPKRGPWAAAL